MPDDKKSKTVGYKRIEQLKNKIEDPLNLNKNKGAPSSRFDLNFQANIQEIDNRMDSV